VLIGSLTRVSIKVLVCGACLFNIGALCERASQAVSGEILACTCILFVSVIF
jgi:hypothetical protein